MTKRIRQLLQQMNSGIYEKEQEISLSLLAAVAGESIILLGPPGVAKSMVARRLKEAFRGARSFEYLMSRFSTPDEIFGPVSIAKLKSSDTYERAVDGYLPTADIVFLDEIWKAGPAIQNTLLTVINEKLFRNGNREMRLPLKLLVAASNELPAKGEGLEALWDRFIIRIESRPVRSEDNFDRMLTDDSEPAPVDEELKISPEEYSQWQTELMTVVLPEPVIGCINLIRRQIHDIVVGDEHRDVYVSDRRWKQTARLIRTSAFLQGRSEASTADLLPVCHCLWQEPDETEPILRMVIRCIFSPYAQTLATIKEDLEADIRTASARRSAGQATQLQQQRDADKKVYNGYYYHLTNHDTGHTFVVRDHFHQLPEHGEDTTGGILYHDPRAPKTTIIRINDGGRVPLGSRPVSLCRDAGRLYIDGIPYDIELNPQQESADLFKDKPTALLHDYDHEIEQLADSLRAKEAEINDSLFSSQHDKDEVRAYLSDFYKEIAFTRQDIAKL